MILNLLILVLITFNNAQEPPEYTGDKVIEGIGICENSRASANRYGIMCWSKQKRYLCKLTEEQAQARVKALLFRYAKNKPDLAWGQAMYIYAPPIENNTPRHVGCIAKNSGVDPSVRIKDLKFSF